MGKQDNKDRFAHYAHCRTLMAKHTRNHMLRWKIALVVLLTNFFCHVMTFGAKYAGQSIQTVAAYIEPEERFSLGKGMGAIVAMAAMTITVIIVAFFVKNAKAKLIAVLAGVAFLGGVTIVNYSHQPAAVANGTVGASFMAFGMGVLALLFSAAVIAVSFFGESKRPLLVYALFGIIFLGWVTDCFHLVTAIVLTILFIPAFLEVREMIWLKEQPGYPLFSESLDEKPRHAVYHADHKRDDVVDTEMGDVYTDPVKGSPDYRELTDEEAIERKLEAHRIRKARDKALLEEEAARSALYRIEDDGGDAMPGVEIKTEEEIAAEQAAKEAKRLAEKPVTADDIPMPTWDMPDAAPIQDVKADDIPMPTWDMPDAAPMQDVKADDIPMPTWDEPASPKKDPVTDHSPITSDFPEIAGDIPDLPDIPDIPKL